MSGEAPVPVQIQDASLPEARNAASDENAVAILVANVENAPTQDEANVNVSELEVTRKKLKDVKRILETIGSSQYYTRNDVITCLRRALNRDYNEVPVHEELAEECLPGYEVPLKVLETVLPPFTGDCILDVNHWLVNFEDFAAMCEWTDMQKVMYCRMLLRGSARLFVNMEKCGFAWDELKSALISEFEDLSNTEMVRKALAQRVKEPEEAFSEYYYKMCHMGFQGKVNTAEVIQYIMNGVKNVEVGKAYLESTTTLRTLKRKLDFIEAKADGGLRTKRRILETEYSRRENYNQGGCATSVPLSMPAIECTHCSECEGLRMERNKESDLSSLYDSC